MAPAWQLAPVIASRAARGDAPARLVVALRPAELGAVEVAVESRAGGPAQVSILAERPETLALLRRDRPALEQALQAAGVEARPDTLSLGLADTPSRGSDGRDHQSAPWQPATSRGGAPAAAAPVLATASARPRARGLLDLDL
jgi:hypothetical protein